jgi:hypothetical protein
MAQATAVIRARPSRLANRRQNGSPAAHGCLVATLPGGNNAEGLLLAMADACPHASLLAAQLATTTTRLLYTHVNILRFVPQKLLEVQPGRVSPPQPRRYGKPSSVAASGVR